MPTSKLLTGNYMDKHGTDQSGSTRELQYEAGCGYCSFKGTHKQVSNHMNYCREYHLSESSMKIRLGRLEALRMDLQQTRENLTTSVANAFVPIDVRVHTALEQLDNEIDRLDRFISEGVVQNGGA